MITLKKQQPRQFCFSGKETEAQAIFPKIIPLFKWKDESEIERVSCSQPRASPIRTQERYLDTVPAAQSSGFGVARLMPGHITGACTGALLRSSGLKFRLGADRSRWQMGLGENVCVSRVWHSRYPLLYQTCLKRQNALASDNSKFARIVDIDVLLPGWE